MSLTDAEKKQDQETLSNILKNAMKAGDSIETRLAYVNAQATLANAAGELSNQAYETFNKGTKVALSLQGYLEDLKKTASELKKNTNPQLKALTSDFGKGLAVGVVAAAVTFTLFGRK